MRRSSAPIRDIGNLSNSPIGSKIPASLARMHEVYG